VASDFAVAGRGAGVDRAAPVQEHRTDRREIVRTPIVKNEAVTWGTPQARWVLLATVLGSGIAFLDATVVNVALPTIGRELHASVAGLQWIVNGYTLTLASLILIGGSLGDRFGRRRMFLVGIVCFAAASLFCGLAPTEEALVAATGRFRGSAGRYSRPGASPSFRHRSQPATVREPWVPGRGCPGSPPRSARSSVGGSLVSDPGV
jgi:hypothetical protein